LVVHASAALPWPVATPNVPAAQSVHVVAPAADHEPAGHVLHAAPLR